MSGMTHGSSTSPVKTPGSAGSFDSKQQRGDQPDPDLKKTAIVATGP